MYEAGKNKKTIKEETHYLTRSKSFSEVLYLKSKIKMEYYLTIKSNEVLIPAIMT